MNSSESPAAQKQKQNQHTAESYLAMRQEASSWFNKHRKAGINKCPHKKRNGKDILIAHAARLSLPRQEI
jgi:hypothetical protein